MVSLPFCFSLWIFEHNTAVTIPKTVTVATHGATKEEVVAIKTPGEGETEMYVHLHFAMCPVTTTQKTVTCVNWPIKQT